MAKCKALTGSAVKGLTALFSSRPTLVWHRLKVACVHWMLVGFKANVVIQPALCKFRSVRCDVRVKIGGSIWTCFEPYDIVMRSLILRNVVRRRVSIVVIGRLVWRTSLSGSHI